MPEKVICSIWQMLLSGLFILLAADEEVWYVYVIVTEKPSVAQEYVKTLKVKGKREEGYVHGHSEVLGKEVAVTWGTGHLCALSYPERYDEALKKWSMEILPFLPEGL